MKAVLPVVRASVVAIVIVSMSTHALTQVRGVPRVAVGKPPFHEDRPPYLTYSGDDLVGVVSGPLTRKSVGPAIVLSGVQQGDKTICVHMEQSNGGYLADLIIPNPKVGPTFQLDLPSKVLTPARFRAGEIAIRAQVSKVANAARCDDYDTLVPASWGNVRTGNTLLVNAKSASFIAASVGNGAANECAKLEDALADKRVKISNYNYVCPVVLPGKCGDTQRVAVQAMDGPRVRKPIIFMIRTPCS